MVSGSGLKKSSAAVRRSRALGLLKRIAASGSLETDELARAVVVTPSTLDAYLRGELSIPLERQLCLALYVIEHFPQLARQGHQLRGQVVAAMAFQAHATEIHFNAPPSRF